MKKKFPIFETYPELSFLDSAATTQKPASVIEAEKNYYKKENANPLRGLYALSVYATEVLGTARKKMAELIHAESADEIIFTRNTSESLNLLAYSLGDLLLNPGDEILITVMEHHSNMIPWQLAAKRHGAVLKYLYPDSNGGITEEEVNAKLSHKTRILAFAQISNVLGVELPRKMLIQKAHEKGAVVVLDGAQGIAHSPINVKKEEIDFYACSAHKMYGPMGIGVLYGKRVWLEKMNPFLTGGEMIDSVSEQSATYAPIPEKFEAGTPNVGGAAGLSAAIDYINEVGYSEIEAREKELVEYCMKKMQESELVELYGSRKADEHKGVISFNIKGIHPHDAASIMDSCQVAVRAGHHCAQPLMNYLKIGSCLRVSFGIYNEKRDVDQLMRAIETVKEYFTEVRSV